MDEDFAEKDCSQYYGNVSSFAETKANIHLLNYVMLTNMQSSVSDYVVPIRKLRDKLLFESKITNKDQKKEIAQGYAYQSIQEVRVEAVSRALSSEIPRAIFGAVFEAILKVKIEIGLRKVEENFSAVQR